MKKLCALFTLFCAITVFGAPQKSGPFLFAGGDVPPNGSLVINLGTLPFLGIFDIHCIILDPNYSDQNPLLLTFTLLYSSQSGTLNGVALTPISGGYEGQLTENTNRLEIDKTTLNKGSYLTITNLSSSDTATVKFCEVEYSSQSHS